MTCGKIQFNTRGEAREWAREAHSRNGSQKMRPYKCDICLHWHLTSGPKAGRAKGGHRKAKRPRQQ